MERECANSKVYFSYNNDKDGVLPTSSARHEFCIAASGHLTSKQVRSKEKWGPKAVRGARGRGAGWGRAVQPAACNPPPAPDLPPMSDALCTDTTLHCQ
ncbi:unnamed protein product [Arctia plantaginis]|uniref:Uncharacterized protein n=1 Tax=Arctia plantaginis TaxID=874455 RepID=A0A8S0ZI78_ARCPL|nr:unnamed protein product [Arctia plantaginis]CAB3250038.1 unnamed protein product [Arctia plantaginis]